MMIKFYGMIYALMLLLAIIVTFVTLNEAISAFEVLGWL